MSKRFVPNSLMTSHIRVHLIKSTKLKRDIHSLLSRMLKSSECKRVNNARREITFRCMLISFDLVYVDVLRDLDDRECVITGEKN